MVEQQAEQIDAIFHALSDSTRRSMLRRLAREELNISELAEPYELTFAAISKHLKVLESAQFVEKTKDGRTFRCRANLGPLDHIHDLLEELGYTDVATYIASGNVLLSSDRKPDTVKREIETALPKAFRLHSELVAVLVDETMTVAAGGTIYDDRGNVLKIYEGRLPAVLEFPIPDGARSFTLVVNGQHYKQPLPEEGDHHGDEDEDEDHH